MDDTTDPSACASPDGAPPTLTPAAGAQTERPVILAVDWPGYAAVPGQPMSATRMIRGSATVAIGGLTVTVALAFDTDIDQPYVYLHDGATSADDDDAIEDAIASAWEARS